MHSETTSLMNNMEERFEELVDTVMNAIYGKRPHIHQNICLLQKSKDELVSILDSIEALVEAGSLAEEKIEQVYSFQRMLQHLQEVIDNFTETYCAHQRFNA